MNPSSALAGGPAAAGPSACSSDSNSSASAKNSKVRMSFTESVIIDIIACVFWTTSGSSFSCLAGHAT